MNRNKNQGIMTEEDKFRAKTFQLAKLEVNLHERMKDEENRIFEIEARWTKQGFVVDKPPYPPAHEVEELSKHYQDAIKLREQIKKMHEGHDKEEGTHARLGLMKAINTLSEKDKSGNGEASQSSQPSRALSKRGGNIAARPGFSGDLDGAADSAASSPTIDGKARNPRPSKMGSQPPRKDPFVKREDSEVPDVPAKSAKITFQVAQEVAVKPKPNPAKPNEHTDWILGTVVKVTGEGKSRRYEVQDTYPDDKGVKTIFKAMGASSMVPIPEVGAPLPTYPIGKVVLARYPQTDAFYRATVAGYDDGEVMLKFEGELDTEKIFNVEKRFVLDHRS